MTKGPLPMPDQLPPVDVIVPVWNRPDEIRVCLSALEQQTYPRALVNVFVVDNGSTDSTPDVVRSFPWAQLVSEPSPGSYCARNTGIAAGVSPYVAFTDSDCLPEPDWLRKGVAALLANPRAGVVTGQVRMFVQDEGADPAVADYEQLFAFNLEKMAAGNCCVTANWFSPRSVLEAVGGFDSRLKSGGDTEMSSRIGRRFEVDYVPDILVAHPARRDRAELVSKERRYVGGRWQGYAASNAQWIRLFTIEAAARTKRILLARLAIRRKLTLIGMAFQIYREQLSELRRLVNGGSPTRD